MQKGFVHLWVVAVCFNRIGKIEHHVEGLERSLGNDLQFLQHGASALDAVIGGIADRPVPRVLRVCMRPQSTAGRDDRPHAARRGRIVPIPWCCRSGKTSRSRRPIRVSAPLSRYCLLYSAAVDGVFLPEACRGGTGSFRCAYPVSQDYPQESGSLAPAGWDQANERFDRSHHGRR